MNVTINSQRLAEELRKLCEIAPKKPAIPVLGSVLIRAEEDILHFSTTDLEVALSTTAHATVKDTGSILLPVAKFLQFIEQCEDADVMIQNKGAQVTLTCRAFTVRMQTMPVEDFPTIPSIDGETITLDAMSFRQMIKKVQPIINPNYATPIMRGALLQLSGAVVAMVSTDGKRLSMTTIMLSENVVNNRQFVLPVKTLNALVGQLQTGTVDVTKSERHLFFTFNNGNVLMSRILEGSYPNYERMIPRNNTHVIEVSVAPFLATLKRVRLASDDVGSICVDIQQHVMKLSSSNVDVGIANESLTIDYDGQPLTIYANGDSIIDFLETTNTSTVSLYLTDATTSMLITAGVDHIGVIVLMRGAK